LCVLLFSIRSFEIAKPINRSMFAPQPLTTTSQELLPAWDKKFYSVYKDVSVEAARTPPQG
jgi:hypothetical protein